MNANLTVADPLADQEVTIIITLAAGEQLRDERPAMVSVGRPLQTVCWVINVSLPDSNRR